MANEKKAADDDKKYPGYPHYPKSEDIFENEKEEPLDDEEPKTGNDLDVPGEDLDDADEKIGEEDEENNYYSLGGDDHNDLEEDKGD